MKILIVMAGFFPGQKFGGPPVSVDNFCTLMDMHQCFIVTRNHDMGESAAYQNVNPGWNDRGNCKVLYLSDREYGYRKYEEVIQEIHPDIIYLQGLFQNCIIPCLALAKKYQLPVLLAPRGELCKGAFKKKYKKIPYILFLRLFRLLDNVHFQSTSDEESTAIKTQLRADDDYIHFLDNIPSLPRQDYPQTEKIVGKGRFVFLSRIHPKKNLLFAIDCFRKVSGSAFFDIYGSIEDEEYWNECLDEIKQLPENVIAEYKGIVPHDQVHDVISKYDAFIFPTLSENYGHVIAESLIVGTPVIISDQTPWTDINGNGAGWAIKLTEPEGFIESINEIVGINDTEMETFRMNCKTYAVKKMDMKKLKESYNQTFSIIEECI